MTKINKYQFIDNSFTMVANNNLRSKIEVEIGDTKQPDTFYPQVKIMRWDNEVNASFRLLDDEPKTLTTEGEKIKLIGAKKEIHFYDIAPCKKHPEGGYEFEVILKEKPKSNVLQFSLVDKDVEYFYQPELTEEEKKTCHRPENIVGSYAVYAKSNKVNYVGGKEYKCGKVGHIFRPKIIDAEGTEVWGELKIENGILSVTIPQDFLDKAVYPVRHAAGLTFGYGSIGETGLSIVANEIHGSIFTCPDSGTATSMTAFLEASQGSPNGHYKMAIYRNSDGALIGGSGSYQESGNFEWQSANVGGSLVASTVYILVNWWDSNSGMEYDSGDANQGRIDTVAYGDWEGTWGGGIDEDKKFSIYCTYETGGNGAIAILTPKKFW